MDGDTKNAAQVLMEFREFVQNNATVWRIGSNHHHPVWARVAECLEAHNLNDVKGDWQLVGPADILQT